MGLSNDQPITAPDQNLFGLDPFAKAVARSIAKLDAIPSQIRRARCGLDS